MHSSKVNLLKRADKLAYSIPMVPLEVTDILETHLPDHEMPLADAGSSQNQDAKSMIRAFLEEKSHESGQLLRARLLERWTKRNFPTTDPSNSEWTFVSKRVRRKRFKENQAKAFEKQRSIEISIPITLKNSFDALETEGSSHQVSKGKGNSWITM